MYFLIRESPAPLNIPTPSPAPDQGGLVACLEVFPYFPNLFLQQLVFDCLGLLNRLDIGQGDWDGPWNSLAPLTGKQSFTRGAKWSPMEQSNSPFSGPQSATIGNRFPYLPEFPSIWPDKCLNAFPLWEPTGLHVGTVRLCTVSLAMGNLQPSMFWGWLPAHPAVRPPQTPPIRINFWINT